MASGGVRPRARRSRSRRRHRLGAVRSALGGGRRRVRLGRGPTAGARDGRFDLLRGPRQGLHQAPPRRTRGAAGHIRRPRAPGRGRAPQTARCDRRRVAPRPPVRPRRGARGARTAQLLGLSVDWVLRATQRLRLERRRRRPGRGVPSDGPRPACGRPRGDPRRGVQPHRGGERVGSDAVLPRDRQRRLLPARREPRAVRRRHRLRQHGRPAPASNAAAGDGRAPLLGGGHARRRLSVRSGGRARTRRQRLRPARLVPGVDRPGPGARRGEADRRAVGYRSLRRRTVPGRVERMEWEVSGHRA